MAVAARQLGSGNSCETPVKSVVFNLVHAKASYGLYKIETKIIS
jgi:hypothetical protein